MQYSSRLARRYERSTKRQSYLLLLGSFALLIIFIVFGFPAILNLTGKIGSMGKGNSILTVEKGLKPITPRLSQDFDATNSATIKLSGIADPKITVLLVQNSQSPVTTISGDDGVFNFTVGLTKGENIFTLQAVSETGVKSDKSKDYKISYIFTDPKLEITSSKDGIIIGKTDPNATVTVNDRLIIVKNDGNFTYTLSLSPGETKVKIVATDRAGNQKVVELTVSITTP